MVCRNCGADLKPGIKYCLECGSYLDEEDDYDEEDEVLDEEESVTEYKPAAPAKTNKKRKRRKLNLSMTDYIIYGGLALVMLISIIIIVVTLAKNNSQTTTPVASPTAATERPDEKVTVDNYTVVIPGKLEYTVQNPFLYIKEGNDYSLSFQIKEDDFDNYMNNQNLLKEQLISSKYEVLSIYDKEVNNRKFLIYEIKVDGSKKVLYLTKINAKYTTFGTIDILETGNWEPALTQIDVICNSVNFQFE